MSVMIARWDEDIAACFEVMHELHLDSGTWREGAHRFCKREGMELTSYHFASKLRRDRVE